MGDNCRMRVTTESVIFNDKCSGGSSIDLHRVGLVLGCGNRVKFLATEFGPSGNHCSTLSLYSNQLNTIMSESAIKEFIRVTNESRYIAEQYLGRNRDDVELALEDYFSQKGSFNAPGTSKSKLKSTRKGGLHLLLDYRGDDNDDEDDQTNFFTGGEKSGLQVENPNKDRDEGDGRRGGQSGNLIEQIFQRAEQQMNQPDDRPSAQANDEEVPQRTFTGRGHRLGDTEGPSQDIEEEKDVGRNKPLKVSRKITFWKQGFTVEDGPLHRYDDPQNAHVLEDLIQGRVPVSLLDVEYGQDVDVSVFRKTNEDYVPPKTKTTGFRGEGVRLGSPVPGELATVQEPVAEKAAEPVKQVAQASASSTESTKPASKSDVEAPVQIRFANGKRVSHRFKISDATADVYTFVRNHEYSEPRPFILSLAFPVSPIEDSSELTVAEAKLKNAVVVQRWV